MDGSHDSRGLLVNMFAETKEKLPKVDVLGDIIELSQVQVTVTLSFLSFWCLLTVFSGDCFLLYASHFGSQVVFLSGYISSFIDLKLFCFAFKLWL